MKTTPTDAGVGSRVRLVPLMMAIATAFVTSPVAAGPLLCNNGISADPAAFRCETVSRSYQQAGTSSALFQFDPYGVGAFAFTNELSFDDVLRDFTLYMSAFYIVPGNPAFSGRTPAGYQPEVFFTTSGPAWIYFFVEDLQDPSCAPNCGEPKQGLEFGPDSNGDPDRLAWVQTITWWGDGEYNDPQVLRDPREQGGQQTSFFGDIITVPGSFDPLHVPCADCSPPSPPVQCEECAVTLKVPADPVISGTANDFSGTIVVSVPEPGSLWLVALGAAAAVRRVRGAGLRGIRTRPERP
jgi:hypothetical protein